MPRLSKLYGPDNQPIDYDELFGQPVAGPTLAGVRSPISGHPADGLTPSRLAAIHRAAAGGDPLAYWELAEDIEERDLHYAAVLGARRRQVAQLSVHVEAASDAPEHVRHADAIRDWLKRDVLDAALFDLLDAIGKGMSILEIEWESAPDLVAPRALTYRPLRWFELDRTDYETPLLLDGLGRLPLAPHKFIIHKHPSKSGLTVRSGLARVASWAWMYKAFTLRDWAVFVQNYGMPARIGKYHPGASDADKETLWRAVANIAGDCAAIVPQGMEIEFVEAARAKQGSAGELYSERADWFDRQVSKLVLGQTATTDAIAGGHAVGKEHREVQGDLERSDAKLISATLTRQLVPFIVAFNFGPQARYPRLVIGRPDETPIETVISALKELGPLGLTVEASALRDRLGFEDPEPAAELIGGRPPPQESTLPPRVASPARGALLPQPAALRATASVVGGRVSERGGHSVSIGPTLPLPADITALKETALKELVLQTGQPSTKLAKCLRGLLASGFDFSASLHLLRAAGEAATAAGLELDDAMSIELPARHAGEADPDSVVRMAGRVAEDAAGALAGLPDAVRAAFDQATSLHDIADRLAALGLAPDQFAEAMSRGMALAHLAGQAALFDGIATATHASAQAGESASPSAEGGDL